MKFLIFLSESMADRALRQSFLGFGIGSRFSHFHRRVKYVEIQNPLRVICFSQSALFLGLS